ncbi:MAG: hypothetical protein AB1491_11605 [Thermodesulfobacteriota bacterium]
MGRKLVGRTFLVMVLLGWWLLGGTPWLAQAEPVHFKQLMSFLDIKPPAGWEVAEKPSGLSTKAPVQLSQAQVALRAGEKQRAEITIMDGLGSALPFMELAQLVEMESSEEYLRPIQIKGFSGRETYRFKDKEGEIILNVANRFLVTLKGEGLENIEPLKSLAQELDLEKLAKLAK